MQRTPQTLPFIVVNLENQLTERYSDCPPIRDEYVKQLKSAFVDVQRDELRKLMKTYYKHCVLNGKTTGDLVYDTVMSQLPPECRVYKTAQKTSRIMLITLSADDTKVKDPKEFFEDAKKAFSKYTWMKPLAMTLEQRQEDQTKDPYGWHIHVVVKDSKYTPSLASEKIYKSFKKYLTAKNYVDCKVHREERAEEICLDYIYGRKQEAKMPKVAYDNVIRERHGIPNAFEFPK